MGNPCTFLSFLFYKLLLRFTLPIAPSNPADMGAPPEAKETERTEQKEHRSARLPPMEEQSINAVEEIIGYKFRHTSLLAEAMTHVSFYFPMKPDKSYERLEFMGDAVLNLGVASDVFFNYQDLAPGTMTRLRAANVDKEKLARVAVTHRLHRYLRHKAPQLESQVRHEFSLFLLLLVGSVLCSIGFLSFLYFFFSFFLGYEFLVHTVCIQESIFSTNRPKNLCYF